MLHDNKNQSEHKPASSISFHEIVSRLHSSDVESKNILFEFINNSDRSEEDKKSIATYTKQLIEFKEAPTDIQLPSKAKPYRIQKNQYAKLLLYAQLAYVFEKNGEPQEHAFKLAAFFEKTESVLDYLNHFSRAKPQALVMHDGCLFSLPEPTYLSTWRNIANKGKRLLDTKFKKLLELSTDIEKLHEQNQREQKETNLDVTFLEEQIKKLKKICKDYEEKPDQRSKIGEENYIKFLEDLQNCQAKITDSYAKTPFTQLSFDALYNYFIKLQKNNNESIDNYLLKMGIPRKKREVFHALDRSQAGLNIPNLFIKGTDINHEGYYLKKLDVSHDINEAAKGACLGKLTDCCQSLSGENGEPCTIHGLTSPFGGFYVICKGDEKNPSFDDVIIAQSWVWLAKEKSDKEHGLVFDSIEVPYKYLNDHQIIVRDFYSYAGLLCVLHHKISKVTVGANKILIEDNALHIKKRYIGDNQKSSDYIGYNDSQHQFFIAHQKWPILTLTNMSRPLIDICWKIFFTLETDESKELKTPSTQIFSSLDQEKRILEVASMVEDKSDSFYDNNIRYLRDKFSERNTDETKEFRKMIPRYFLFLEKPHEWRFTDTVSSVTTFKNLGFRIDTYVKSGEHSDLNHSLVFLLKIKANSAAKIILSEIGLNTYIGDTHPLILALQNDNHGVVEWIIEHPFFIKQNDILEHAITFASFNNCLSTLFLLVESGASLKTSSGYKGNLLMAAAQGGADKTAAVLCKNLPIDAQDEKGMTALMYAVNKPELKGKMADSMREFTEREHRCVRVLLSKKPRLDLKNKKGETVFDIAKNNSSMLSILRAYEKSLQQKTAITSMGLLADKTKENKNSDNKETLSREFTNKIV